MLFYSVIIWGERKYLQLLQQVHSLRAIYFAFVHIPALSLVVFTTTVHLCRCTEGVRSLMLEPLVGFAPTSAAYKTAASLPMLKRQTLVGREGFAPSSPRLKGETLHT
jgi:hypothetical protein